MLTLHGISAWVEVDGKELEQYGVEEDPDQSLVTCWIATQANKSFSVVFRDNVTYREHSLASTLHLDGSAVAGKVLDPPTRLRNFSNSVRTRTVVQSDQTLSATSACPFMFSKLELTDEDEYLHQASAHLGEIRLIIRRTEVLEELPFQPGSSAHGHGKVHERSKKAVTHSVSYGPEIKTATRNTCRVRYLDGNIPLVTFTFRYRDSSLLQANGIIPPPPPAEEKAVVEEEVLDLTIGDNVKPEPINEEIEVVDGSTQKRKAAPSTKRSNLGREGRVPPPKRIKQEKRFVPTGEVIDLT